MAATNSMTNYLTTFESTQNLVKTIEIGHGENADLVANFTDNGIPVSLSGFTARALFQPKSEWGTDNWYECPCEISEDTTIAHWSNDSDNGDNAVKLFMYLLKDGKVAYPAIYRIGLFETPGHTPGSIIPIQKTLDFSEYNLVNAPWVLPSDLSAYATKSELEDYPTRAEVTQGWFGDWTTDKTGYEIRWSDGTGILTDIGWYVYSSTTFTESSVKGDAQSVYLSWTEGIDAGVTITATRQQFGGPVPTKPSDIGAQPAGDYVVISALEDVESDVSTLSGNVGTLSSNVSTLSGKVGTVQTSLSATQKLIFDGFSGGSTLYPHYTLAVQNRQINGINISQYYQSDLNIRLPEYTPTNAIYAILDVNNTNGNTSGWYLRFVQPTLGTWKIMMDANTTMNELTAVPQHSYVRYYICQWGAALEGGTTGNEWGALHIRKEVLQLTTI